MVFVLGTVIICEACVCIGIGFRFGVRVGCLWICIIVVFGGRLMYVEFVVGDIVG